MMTISTGSPERKLHPYLGVYDAPKKANELLNFARKNVGCKKLLTSLVERYRDRIEGLEKGLLEDPSVFVGRMQRLQGLIQGSFKYPNVIETAVRRLDTGISILIALPDDLPVNIRQIYAGDCETPVLRLDIARATESSLGANTQTALVRNGWQFIAAIGRVSLDKKARVADEVLDGVKLFINDDHSCTGRAITFRGPGLTHLSEEFNFSHNRHLKDILHTIKDVQDLSFCQKSEASKKATVS